MAIDNLRNTQHNQQMRRKNVTGLDWTAQGQDQRFSLLPHYGLQLQLTSPTFSSRARGISELVACPNGQRGSGWCMTAAIVILLLLSVLHTCEFVRYK
jgi:hypothetical protein